MPVQGFPVRVQIMTDHRSERLKFLRGLMPQARVKDLVSWASLPLHRAIDVFVTTTSRAHPRAIQMSIQIWQAPYFNLRFAVAPGNAPSSLQPEQCIVYPARIEGDLHKIRRFLSERFGRHAIISDDDPGYLHRTGRYESRSPCGQFPARNKSGAVRRQLLPWQHALLWRGAFHFGEKFGCDYVGLNGSTQAGASLPDHMTTGRNPSASHGRHGYRPLVRDCVISGAAGVIRSSRNLVPPSLRGIHQEWSTASLASIAARRGTLMVMPVQLPYAVRPPSHARAEILMLRNRYPEIIHSNPQSKTCCVVKLKTRREVDFNGKPIE